MSKSRHKSQAYTPFHRFFFLHEITAPAVRRTAMAAMAAHTTSQRGESTQSHDQPMFPVSFRMMNTRVRLLQKPIPVLFIFLPVLC